MAKIKK